MSQKRSITDFFKPFGRPQSPKRPPSDDDLSRSEPPRKSRSNTPPRSLDQEASSQTSSTAGSQQTSSQCAAHLASTRSTDNSGQNESTQAIKTPKQSVVGSLEQWHPTHLGCHNFASSQGPLLASSQRVVRHGEVMIRNSDDESDSDSSLEDLSDLLRPKTQADPASSSPLTEISSPTPSIDDQQSREERSRTRQQTKATVDKNVPTNRSKAPPPPRYRFDLGTLVQRSAKQEDCEAGINKARMALDSIEQNVLTNASSHPYDKHGDQQIDTGLIDSAFKGSEDANGVKKLMMALQRTEALQKEKSWSFFDSEEENVSHNQGIFPIENLEHCQSIFKGLSPAIPER